MFIAIGKIIQLYGIKGYVRAVSYSGNLERFLKLETLYIEKNNETEGMILEDIIVQEKSVLIKFKNINNREEAVRLVRRDLLVPYEQKIKLPKDEFFVHDLIGLKVFDIDGNYLGVLEDVFQMGMNDIYQINHGKDEILIPAVSEFIKKISLKEKKITVQLIEGMVD